MTECNKDCLNCPLEACIYDIADGTAKQHIPEQTRGLNERLSLILKQRRIRQKTLSEKTGISEPAISAYCNGVRKPRADHIVIICKTIGISADWLLGMNNDAD
jgi:DNA-binding Xre family transcriptional regulator